MRKIFSSITSRRLPVLFVALFAAFVLYGCGSDEGKDAGDDVKVEDSGDPAKDSFKRGVQHSLKGNHDKAIEAYNESLKHNPHSAVVHSNLGFEFYDKELFDKSVESQEKALDMDPELANAYYGLAMALEKKGDNDGAAENYREFMKISKPHSLWWNNAKATVERLESK
ncbi:MAG: tetratricopeptide repeat protein [Proteobacteria bacterium]|nr:tetratricopeptide repeat protein [Pseudomonadota bacterium]